MIFSLVLSATALAAPDYVATKLLLGFATGLNSAALYLVEQETKKNKKAET